MTLPLNHTTERHAVTMAQLALDMAGPRRMGWANAHAVRAQHDAELLAIYAAAHAQRPVHHLRFVKG